MTTTDNAALLLSSLEMAIRQDRRFFVAAQADPTFSPMEAEVEGLLGRLLHEAKARAEPELAAAQAAFAELKAWHGEIDTTMAAIAQLEDKVKTGSYFGYLDALPLAMVAKDAIWVILQAQKTALRKTLDELSGQAGALRSSVVALIGDNIIPWTSRNDKAGIMAEAERQHDEARKQMQTERYVSWMQALESFRQCIETLRPLDLALSKEKSEVLAEAEYQRLIAKAEDDHRYKLGKLHQAMVLLLFYCVTPWIGALISWAAGGALVLGFQFGGMASFFLLIFADGLWSTGINKLDAKYPWIGPCLFWVGIINTLIAPILTIVVYVRGMKLIEAEFQAAVDFAERERRRIS